MPLGKSPHPKVLACSTKGGVSPLNALSAFPPPLFSGLGALLGPLLCSLGALLRIKTSQVMALVTVSVLLTPRTLPPVSLALSPNLRHMYSTAYQMTPSLSSHNL